MSEAVVVAVGEQMRRRSLEDFSKTSGQIGLPEVRSGDPCRWSSR